MKITAKRKNFFLALGVRILALGAQDLALGGTDHLLGVGSWGVGCLW